MKKLVSIISILLVLMVMASAVTLDELSQSRFYTTTAADAIVEFMTDNGLNEENFSMAYLNTVTGELLSFNEHTLMLAASTYKLPLNMLYCDMIAEGILTEDTEITAELKKTLKEGEELPEGAVLIEETDSTSETTVDGETAPVQYKISRSGIVGELMRKSLVDSDNDTSELLLRYAYEGKTYDHYLDRISVYGDYDFSGFDREMLYDNYFPCDYMIGCLQYLYEHSVDYAVVIDYLKQAQPGMYFKRYLSCEVAHKYGYLGDNYNDVGIIYTETPFLLACYTDGVPNGENVVGRLAELMAEYTDYTTAHDAYVAEHVDDEPEPTPEPEISAEPLTEEEKLQQMIDEIEAIESAPVIVISPDAAAEPEETPAESEPVLSPEPIPEVLQQPEPVQPEPEKNIDILSILLPGAVIVLCIVVIAVVLRSGSKKKKRRRKKGKHAARR